MNIFNVIDFSIPYIFHSLHAFYPMIFKNHFFIYKAFQTHCNITLCVHQSEFSNLTHERILREKHHFHAIQFLLFFMPFNFFFFSCQSISFFFHAIQFLFFHAIQFFFFSCHSISFFFMPFNFFFFLLILYISLLIILIEIVIQLN